MGCDAIDWSAKAKAQMHLNAITGVRVRHLVLTVSVTLMSAFVTDIDTYAGSVLTIKWLMLI